MLGIEASQIFHPHPINNGKLESHASTLSPVALPKLTQCARYFRQFIHTYEAAKLLRTLQANAQSGHFMIDVNLEECLLFKADEHHQCVETPYCNKKEHVLPSNFLELLFHALALRPLHYLPICEEVCLQEVQKSMKLAQEHSTNNRATIHPLTLPSVTSIQINLLNTLAHAKSIRGLLADTQEKFVVVPGIIVQAGRPIHKMNKMTLQCRFCDHKLTLDIPSWKDKLPIPRTCRYSSSMSQQSTGIRNPVERQLGCHGQLDPYTVVPTECTYIDVQSLKLQELPEDVPTGDIPRHLQLNASRYLCEEMAPGDRVFIHGVLTSYNPNPKPTKSDGTNSTYLHVLGFQKYDPGKGENTNFTLEEKNMFRTLAASPDIHSLIFRSIAPAIYGMEDVKMATACLMFGATRKQLHDSSKVRGDINMLMLGDPSVAKSQILKFVDRVSPISVYTSGKGSSAAGLTAAVVRDRNGIFSLEGGAMVLADGGVVCVDEFDKMNNDDVVAIHEAMEQQTISISKAGITTMLNTRCAVIAAANPSFGSFDDTQDTTEQHEFKATILSRFDLIFMLRDKEDQERDTTLCTHILSLHAQQNKAQEGEIPTDVLRRYIQYARLNCMPMLSREGSDSLRNFYVKTRREYREDQRANTKKIPITLRQLESLVRIAESFAKMELLDYAGDRHVNMAIELFSKSTAASAKQALLIENMNSAEQRRVQQAEEAILSRLQHGQRSSRANLLRDLQGKGFDRSTLSRALMVLIKKKELQERSDRSIRRP